jgi:hypothetical protein
MQKRKQIAIFLEEGVNGIEYTLYFTLFKPGRRIKLVFVIPNGRNEEKRR